MCATRGATVQVKSDAEFVHPAKFRDGFLFYFKSSAAEQYDYILAS